MRQCEECEWVVDHSQSIQLKTPSGEHHILCNKCWPKFVKRNIDNEKLWDARVKPFGKELFKEPLAN